MDEKRMEQENQEKIERILPAYDRSAGEWKREDGNHMCFDGCIFTGGTAGGSL